MKGLEILENNAVRFNNEEVDYDVLKENFELVETLNTEEGQIDIFKVESGGYIEYFGDSCFFHGESANYTECTIEEIKSSYKLID